MNLSERDERAILVFILGLILIKNYLQIFEVFLIMKSFFAILGFIAYLVEVLKHNLLLILLFCLLNYGPHNCKFWLKYGLLILFLSVLDHESFWEMGGGREFFAIYYLFVRSNIETHVLSILLCRLLNQDPHNCKC